jgi:hypothetical protein
MSDECDCGWCGRCAEQVAYQRELENRSGYGCDYYSDDKSEQEDD